jgi:hypothetical protein
LPHSWWAQRTPDQDCAARRTRVTAPLIEAALAQAQALGRPTPSSNTSAVRREAHAEQIAARDDLRPGLSGVCRRVQPALSLAVRKNRERGKREIKYRERRCLHLYPYQIHPVFGFRHARIQTWFPVPVPIGRNGREGRARQLDAARRG